MSCTKTLIQEQKSSDGLWAVTQGILGNENVAFGLVLVLALIVRAVVLARGFVSVSADDYARVLLAAGWAESPYFIGRYILEITDLWQPWHFYLLGLALKIHDGDLFLTARIVTVVFSLISLGMFYLLVRRLLDRWVALLSVLIVGLLPVHVFLSLTPVADIVFVAFTISFLYFFFVWLDSRADGHLLLAALMVGLASGLRFDGWFTTAIFSAYLGLRSLIELWNRRSLHPLWLVAIGLACLPICMWLLTNYVYWRDPFHFLVGRKGSGSAVREIGPLTYWFARLAYVELLLQSGSLICLLAMAGIGLSYRSLTRRIWFYLVFGLSPFVILILRGGTPGTSYRPHYPFPYLVLLVPFCAYAIYWAIGATEKYYHHRRQPLGWVMLTVVSLYNLWLVYLRFSQKQSWVLLSLLALTGIVLSRRLLDHKRWLYWTFSLAPLPFLMLISRVGVVSGWLPLYTGMYFVILALFYAYIIWRSRGVLEPPTHYQWRAAGLGILVVLCLCSLWGVLFEIPTGMPDSVNKAGLLVRRLFEEGFVAEDDRVLFETEKWNYLGMQVMSEHPRNFVLDRAPNSDTESFLLDKSSSPYGIGPRFTRFEQQVNPLVLDPPPSLGEYLKDEHIRLVIVKDPRLEALLVQQTDLKKIDQVEDYLFYYAAQNE